MAVIAGRPFYLRPPTPPLEPSATPTEWKCNGSGVRAGMRSGAETHWERHTLTHAGRARRIALSSLPCQHARAGSDCAECEVSLGVGGAVVTGLMPPPRVDREDHTRAGRRTTHTQRQGHKVALDGDAMYAVRTPHLTPARARVCACACACLVCASNAQPARVGACLLAHGCRLCSDRHELQRLHR